MQCNIIYVQDAFGMLANIMKPKDHTNITAYMQSTKQQLTLEYQESEKFQIF